MLAPSIGLVAPADQLHSPGKCNQFKGGGHVRSVRQNSAQFNTLSTKPKKAYQSVTWHWATRYRSGTETSRIANIDEKADISILVLY
jgi:hypothetical protein